MPHSNLLETAFPALVGDGGLPIEAANDALGVNRRATPPEMMSEGERLTRAREATIAALPRWLRFRWLLRRIRAGRFDYRYRATLIALEDAHKPMSRIILDRDEATVALILRTTPGLTKDEATVAALLTAVRMGRRG